MGTRHQTLAFAFECRVRGAETTGGTVVSVRSANWKAGLLPSCYCEMSNRLATFGTPKNEQNTTSALGAGITGTRCFISEEALAPRSGSSLT